MISGKPPVFSQTLRRIIAPWPWNETKPMRFLAGRK
jgi:hypothetical protein